MKLRRVIAKDHMRSDEFPITLTTYPMIGRPGVFTDPYYPVSGPRLRSQFVPDEIANPHIRFPTLAANIRWRRGKKVQVNVPVFKDKNTPWPWKDPTVNHDLHNWPEDDDVRNGAAPDNFIHMDAMAFGMGSCCLQITFQAKNITEGRKMYDQLSPLGPILLALTAATPIYKGFLADTDVRWNQISSAVDDRTPEELGEKVSPYTTLITSSGPHSPVLTFSKAPSNCPLAYSQIPLRLQLNIYLHRPPSPPRILRPRPSHRPPHQAKASRRRHGRPPRHPLCPSVHPRPHRHL